MREEILRIGIACITLGLVIPLVLAIVHGVDAATPLLIYTIPVLIAGVALLVLSKRANPESAPSLSSSKPDFQ